MNKPMIRHCYNCKYKCEKFFHEYCLVKYEYINSPRLRALMCRFYEQKEVKGND